MTTAQKPSDEFSPTKKQLLTICFLATTLFIASIIKAGMDYHWWLPKTEIVSSLKPEDIKIKFDINSCPWHELVLLPALGETKAKAIVAYRERHGNFTTLDDLEKVKGIGTSIIAAIRDYVTVGSATTSASKDNQE